MAFIIHSRDSETCFKDEEREKQMDFYESCIYLSEGCERDRYVSIYFGLKNDRKYVDDEWEWMEKEL